MQRLARRYGLDIAIAIAAAAALAEELLGGRGAAESAPAVAGVIAVALVVPLLARRRSPFLACAVLWPSAAAVSFFDGGLVTGSSGVYAAGMISAFLLGSLQDARQGRVGLAMVLAGAVIIVVNDPGHADYEVALVPAPFALAWLAGYAQRERAAQAREAEARALTAERERAVAARIAVAEERARIARELHDVVAHALSVMVLQTGAVRHRLPDDLAEDVDALRGVEETGRSALSEMRRLLGLLRRGDEQPERSPQPGLAQLGTLLRDVRRAGLPVDLRVDGEPVQLPLALDLSAYRIVQEGLTNVLKHAHAAGAHVHLSYAAAEVRIEISDDGGGGAVGVAPVNGHDGHGLLGIRERVQLYGGEMTAAPLDGGGFRLAATLPLGEEAA